MLLWENGVLFLCVGYILTGNTGSEKKGAEKRTILSMTQYLLVLYEKKT